MRDRGLSLDLRSWRTIGELGASSSAEAIRVPVRRSTEDQLPFVAASPQRFGAIGMFPCPIPDSTLLEHSSAPEPPPTLPPWQAVPQGRHSEKAGTRRPRWCGDRCGARQVA
jgi:hypothetical protein